MSVDYTRKAAKATRMIDKYGMKAILRRSSGDRYCTVVEMDFDAQENPGRLANPTGRDFLVAVQFNGNAILPPDHLQDSLVTLVPGSSPDQEVDKLKIVQPPGRLAPAGVPIYYELIVRG